MGNLQNERALGVHWNIENDYLGWNHSLEDQLSPPLVQSMIHWA